jgi:ERCC4-type nuclease
VRRKVEPFAIRVDTREQLPYDFELMRDLAELPFVVERGTLSTGDYATHASSYLEADACVVERKSLSDLYSTLSSGRDRFEREWQRMAMYGHACLVIEADWSAIVTPNDHLRRPSELNPKSVAATLIAWGQRYGVHVHALPNRQFAEMFTFRILERWVRDRRASVSALTRTASTE